MDKSHCPPRALQGWVRGGPGNFLRGFHFLLTDKLSVPEAARFEEGRDVHRGWGLERGPGGEPAAEPPAPLPIAGTRGCCLPGWSPRKALPSEPARQHRSRLVRAIMEHFKHNSIKKRAELSPPHASAVP